jgi:hypothetical protein
VESQAISGSTKNPLQVLLHQFQQPQVAEYSSCPSILEAPAEQANPLQVASHLPRVAHSPQPILAEAEHLQPPAELVNPSSAADLLDLSVSPFLEASEAIPLAPLKPMQSAVLPLHLAILEDFHSAAQQPRPARLPAS